MSPNDKQSDAIVANIEAGNYETGFRANAALIEWTKMRDGSASSLCIKTLLEMLSSCTFGETTDEIVKEFATFMMAQIGKKEGRWRFIFILALIRGTAHHCVVLLRVKCSQLVSNVLKGHSTKIRQSRQ